MKKTAVLLTLAVLAGAMIVNPGHLPIFPASSLGPSPASAQVPAQPPTPAPPKDNGLVPNEATGFSGVLAGQVVGKPNESAVDKKWLFFKMKVTKVVSFDPQNKAKITLDALNAIWKGRTVNVGPANNVQPLPEILGGDLVLVAGHQFEAHIRQTQVLAFKPGEDEPGCYVYLKKTENGNKVTLTLRKIQDVKTVTLALEKGPDGQMAPKADLLNAVNALKEKTVVMVQLDKDVLTGIKPYEPPRKGEFVKAATQKVGEQTVQAAEIKDDQGTSQTLPLSLSPKNQAELIKTVRALKAGAAVFYRTETDDKGTWLTDLRAQ